MSFLEKTPLRFEKEFFIFRLHGVWRVSWNVLNVPGSRVVVRERVVEEKTLQKPLETRGL